MDYLRNGEPLTARQFWARLRHDIAYIETNEVDPVDYASAKRDLKQGKQIQAGRDGHNFNRYFIEGA